MHLSTSLTQTHGLRPGDVISIVAPNSIWYPVALFGIMRMGVIPALSSPKATVEEMVHVLRTVRPRAVMLGGECEELGALVRTVREAIGRVARGKREGKVEVWILGEKGFEGLEGLGDLCEEAGREGQAGEVESWKVPERTSNKDFSAVLCFSSGTTGLPKAVGRIPSTILRWWLMYVLGYDNASQSYSTVSPASADDLERPQDNPWIAAVFP